MTILNRYVNLLIMKWTIEYHEKLEEWLDTLPADIKAKILRIVEMLVCYEPHNAREPYVRPVRGYKKLFEIRTNGKGGIARVFYFTMSGKRIILIHGFIKKTTKTPKKEINIALQRMKEMENGQVKELG